MLEEIIIEKMCLVKNRFYAVNKYRLWFIEAKEIIKDYSEQTLSREKIYEFISFLVLTKQKFDDIDFVIVNDCKILNLDTEEYNIRFFLEPKEFKIEYSIKINGTRYLFNVNEESNYSDTSNILYTHVKYNINDILNKIVYNVCKKYMLG